MEDLLASPRSCLQSCLSLIGLSDDEIARFKQDPDTRYADVWSSSVFEILMSDWEETHEGAAVLYTANIPHAIEKAVSLVQKMDLSPEHEKYVVIRAVWEMVRVILRRYCRTSHDLCSCMMALKDVLRCYGRMKTNRIGMGSLSWNVYSRYESRLFNHDGYTQYFLITAGSDLEAILYPGAATCADSKARSGGAADPDEAYLFPGLAMLREQDVHFPWRRVVDYDGGISRIRNKPRIYELLNHEKILSATHPSKSLVSQWESFATSMASFPAVKAIAAPSPLLSSEYMGTKASTPPDVRIDIEGNEDYMASRKTTGFVPSWMLEELPSRVLGETAGTALSYAIVANSPKNTPWIKLFTNIATLVGFACTFGGIGMRRARPKLASVTAKIGALSSAMAVIVSLGATLPPELAWPASAAACLLVATTVALA